MIHDKIWDDPEEYDKRFSHRSLYPNHRFSVEDVIEKDKWKIWKNTKKYVKLRCKECSDARVIQVNSPTKFIDYYLLHGHEVYL